MAIDLAVTALPGAARGVRHTLLRRHAATRRVRARAFVLRVIRKVVGGLLGAAIPASVVAGTPAPTAAQLLPTAIVQQLRFRHLGVDDGLPSSLVTSVT